MKTRKIRLKKKLEPERTTRKGKVIFVLLLVLVVVGFVVGVNLGVAQKNSDLYKSADLRTGGLHYQLKMERTNYRLGEPIKVQLFVTNVTPNAIVLKFQKNLEFDLTVRKEVDLLFAQVPKTVWKLSENQMVYKDVHSSQIEAGKTLAFNGTWNQKDRAGKPVQPGNYQIIGNLLADDRTEALQIRGQTSDE